MNGTISEVTVDVPGGLRRFRGDQAPKWQYQLNDAAHTGRLTASAAKPAEHRFPSGFNAYWLRTVAESGTMAAVMLTYS